MFAVIAVRPLATSATATSMNVGSMRRAVRGWLTEALDDEPDVVDDLTLAISEALENAADHAFADTATVGTMCLEAADHGDHITIVVSDDGHWQPPDPDPGFRGRGIDLIHRLVDASSIEPGVDGTSVTLVHHRVPTPRDHRD